MPSGPRFLIAAVLVAAGCKSYERRPLDLAGYSEAWKQRSLAGDAVRQYAEKLAAARGEESAQFDPADGLSLAEAEAVALCFNPELRAARLEAKVPLAGARNAGRLADPELGFDLLRILDSVDDPWIAGVGVGFTLPLSGRLQAEKSKAWAEYDAAWRRVVVQEAQLVARLHAAWLRWSAARERVRLLREHLAGLAKMQEVADSLARAGEMKSVDARVLRIDRSVGRAELEQLEAAEAGARLALLALLGLVPDAPVSLAPSLGVRPVDSSGGVREAVLAHPEIAVARAEYEIAERTLQREARKQYPDLTFGPQFEDDEGQASLGFSLGLTLPLWNRNARGIAEALAEREAARVRAEAALEALVGRHAGASHRVAASRRLREMLVEAVSPLLQEQRSELDRLIELGELDVLLLKDLLDRSLETKRKILDATLEEALAAAEIAAILRPLWTAGSERENES